MNISEFQNFKNYWVISKFLGGFLASFQLLELRNLKFFSRCFSRCVQSNSMSKRIEAVKHAHQTRWRLCDITLNCGDPRSALVKKILILQKWNLQKPKKSIYRLALGGRITLSYRRRFFKSDLTSPFFLFSTCSDCLDIRAARTLLDNDHYAMDKLKRRVLEYLAVRQLKTSLKVI